MVTYNLIRDPDKVIPFISNSTKLVVDTSYDNSLSILSSQNNKSETIIIDWGDGTINNYELGTNDSISHKYVKDGVYNVLIKHTANISLKFYDQNIITEVIHIGTMLNYTGTFMQCENIRKLHRYCFKMNNNVKVMNNTFQNCYSLQTLPEDLFNNLVNLENIDEMFKGSGLIILHETMFKSNYNLKSLSGTFQDTIITNLPSKIFNNCKKIKNLSYCFAGSSIKTVGDKVFDNLTLLEDISYIFCNCFSLEKIPENLFKNCTILYNITKAFFNNISLKHFPETTFKYNNNVYKNRHVLTNSPSNKGQQIIWIKDDKNVLYHV